MTSATDGDGDAKMEPGSEEMKAALAAALTLGLAAAAGAAQDPEKIGQLTIMGFDEATAKAALAASNGNVEDAVEWISNGGTVQQDVAMTGEGADGAGAGGGEGGSGQATLTLEERMALAQKKIQEKKRQRLAAEKKARKEKEMKRREEGQKMIEAREELQKKQRMMEYERRKKEKDALRLERERIRAQLALDKAERLAAIAAAKGVTVESLGGGTDLRKTILEGAKANPRKRMDACALLLTTKKDGTGARALKTLRVYLKNALTKPDPKFRRVNMENKAFQQRVAAIRGGKKFMLAAGFEENTDENALVLPDSADKGLLEAGLDIIAAALAKLG